MSVTFSPITDDKVGIWTTVKCDVDPQGNLRELEVSSKYGTLYFGIRSDGHLGWSWAETNGGGAVSVIFSLQPDKSIIDGLWVALLPEIRANMGEGEHLCIVGGFKKPNEEPALANSREFASETGGEAIRAQPALAGVPINGNRNFFMANVHKGEGIHAFALEVPFETLIVASDGTREHNSWKPKGKGLVFMPWREMAVHTPDAYAGLPILRLLAALTETKDSQSELQPGEKKASDC
jgi:hypothetical protein